MSEDSHHHFFHRHKNEEKPVVDFKTEKKHQGHLEHCAELAATAAGAYALHEKHLAVKDPEHARMHKFKEGIATAAAVAAGGIALHYHQEKEEIKKKEEEAKKKEKREKEERKKEAKKK